MEMNLDKRVNVKSRGTGTTSYLLPESGIRREFAPGEIKKNITVKELEELSYLPGGRVLMDDYLIINDEEVCEYLGLEVEPEYYYDEAIVKTLLETGSTDQLLDCVEFAPVGVLDIIKKVSVAIKLNDIAKRNIIKEKLDYDITAIIANIEYANSSDETAETAKAGRRAAPITENKPAEVTTGRRTAPVTENKYNVVSRN